MHGVVVRNVVKLVVQCAVVDVGAWWVFEEVIWRDCVGDHGCSCDCMTSWTCFGEERDQRDSPRMTHERLKMAGCT